MNKRDENLARKLSLLSEIAVMYYEDGLTQDQIAENVSISRTRISRLLQEARDKKIIRIEVNYKVSRNYRAEDLLKAKFGLKDARIFNSRNSLPENVIKGVAGLAADYFEEIIKPNQVVGVSWGRFVSATINEMTGNPDIKPTVVQLMGATHATVSYIDVPGLIRKMIRLYDGKGYYLNAPLYIEDEIVRKSLKQQPLVANTIEKANLLDIVVTGIGDVSHKTFSYVWEGYDVDALLEEMKSHNAVGSVLARTYDINGKPITNDLNDRIIGVDLNKLKRVKTVIGVAGGDGKARAILGALRGGFINVLISDSTCVNEVLDLFGK